MILDDLTNRVLLAPLAGGPSTPELTAAVANAGAFGFLAAGYLTAAELADRLDRTRELTAAPFGINLFVPDPPTDHAAVENYRSRLIPLAERYGVTLGDGRHDDDDWHGKLELLRQNPLPVASFTFGCPPPDVIDTLHSAGTEVWVTVTTAAEAVQAEAAGADAIICQGDEAGGHRGSFTNDPRHDAATTIGLLPLLQLTAANTRLPMVAAGGLSSGRGIAAALAAGARAAAVGTAFLRCPEAGSSPVHQAALTGTTAGTVLTRAYTGRLARGLRTAFTDEHSDAAPAAYPDVHRLTAPLRAEGRRRGDPAVVNLWAGQAHPLATAEPAGDLVTRLHRDTVAALAAVTGHDTATSEVRPRAVIRPVTRADSEAVAALGPRLSARSMLRRFHAPLRELPASYLAAVIDDPFGDHLLAELPPVPGRRPSDGGVIGLVSFGALDGHDRAHRELGLVVVDRWQGSGVGRALLDAALTAATEAGARTITALVLPDAVSLLATLDRRLPRVHSARSTGQASARYDLTRGRR